MKQYYLILLLLATTACNQAKDKPQQVTAQKTTAPSNAATRIITEYAQANDDNYPAIGKAHPNAKRLMNEHFFWSPIDETAPFGNDDGADAYADYTAWRKTHKKGHSIDFLQEEVAGWGYPAFDLRETDFDKLQPYLKQNSLGNRCMYGTDAAVIAVAFGQLYLEGTIDNDFKELARLSIKRELIPEILDSWGETYKVTRARQLRKMLAVLDQVQ